MQPEHIREEIPQQGQGFIRFSNAMYKSQLLDTYHFLEKVSGFNEDTEYDPADQPHIDALRNLAESRDQKAIVEEFNKPFLHPMVTIQQHVDELKELVRLELLDRQADPG
ncbi:hypothetical protein LZD49_01820 [Dyadobacter sp. CY261]|uniref:hypothetical protein n=1 Tax=Dyadobacter sp. CY261 TaxID=2907203 RepID=UPI001F2E7261|nr:hypothetical protein [Dyadobacter sp. CY261]MCF0069190.1 hypothetical protein [Dyadobacter sp. CY261]